MVAYSSIGGAVAVGGLMTWGAGFVSAVGLNVAPASLGVGVLTALATMTDGVDVTARAVGLGREVGRTLRVAVATAVCVGVGVVLGKAGVAVAVSGARVALGIAGAVAVSAGAAPRVAVAGRLNVARVVSEDGI
jgi:hypothetical protein